MKKILMGVVFALSSMAVWAAQDVAVQLSAQKVQLTAKGEEQMVSAAKAAPGDVLQYSAVYTNSGKAEVEKLEATLPIPEGTEYIAASATPAKALASLDGVRFEPMPIKRKKTVNGKEVEVEVPVSEYKALRWQMGELKADGKSSVSARVRLGSRAGAVNVASVSSSK